MSYFEKMSEVYLGNSRDFWILITFISGSYLFYLTSKLNVTAGYFISSLAIGISYLRASILRSGSSQRQKQDSTPVLKLQAFA